MMAMKSLTGQNPKLMMKMTRLVGRYPCIQLSKGLVREFYMMLGVDKTNNTSKGLT